MGMNLQLRLHFDILKLLWRNVLKIHWNFCEIMVEILYFLLHNGKILIPPPPEIFVTLCHGSFEPAPPLRNYWMVPFVELYFSLSIYFLMVRPHVYDSEWWCWNHPRAVVCSVVFLAVFSSTFSLTCYFPTLPLKWQKVTVQLRKS